MKRWIPDWRSLSAQMILSFVALVLLTAVAAGLPAIWLIRDQLGRQAWAQVEQGSLAAQSLYEAKENELQSLATLTAQRPTLRDLVAKGEQDTLSVYLHTLQEGSGLDLVLVCDSDQLFGQAGQAAPKELCAVVGRPGYFTDPAGPLPRVWFLAAHALDGKVKESAATVIVGVALDDRFAAEMSTQTGLEHTLLVNGQSVATSSPVRRTVSSPDLKDALQDTFDVDGHPYYAAHLPLDGASLRAEVALEVSDIASTQRRLVWALASTILVVAIAASLLPFWSP